MPGWHPHPDVLLLLVILGAGYVWLVRRVSPRFVHPIERAVTRRQAISFTTGLFTLGVASYWPIHDLAEGYLYSAHMVQHLLLTLVAPPLLLVGMPAWMLRLILGRRGLQVAKFLTRPLIALVAFNAMIAVSHIPAVVELAARSEPFHLGAHVLLVGTAFMMWSPVLNPLIELPKLSYPSRMLYLFLQSLVPTVPASFLTFGHTVLYHVYEEGPGMWGISALTDQRVAGLIMKLAGGAILWTVITWYFFKWFTVEEREKVDVLEWSKLEPTADKERTELANR
ncbi:MAG: cytochrome c oxidase assembly protein [Actinomycetota bacterium]